MYSFKFADWMANSIDPDEAIWSWSTMFAKVGVSVFSGIRVKWLCLVEMHSGDADHETTWKNNADSDQNALGLNCCPICSVRWLFFGNKEYIKTDSCGVNKFFWARLSSLSQLGLISFKIPLWKQWFQRTENIIYTMMKGSMHFPAAKHSLYTRSSKVLKSKHWQVHCLWV